MKKLLNDVLNPFLNRSISNRNFLYDCSNLKKKNASVGSN